MIGWLGSSSGSERDIPWASFRVRISSSFDSSTDTAFLYLRTDNI
ncbi:MAG: hypothetical protein ACO2O5_00530 [Candidatus Caldipriscus sp.]